MVEVDEGAGGPDALLNLFAGDELTGTLEKQLQNLNRLTSQTDGAPAFAELAGSRVELKRPETQALRAWG